MIIFPHQITAKQMGFSFEFLVARIIFALGRTFQNLEKTLKMYLPSTHPKLLTAWITQLNIWKLTQTEYSKVMLKKILYFVKKPQVTLDVFKYMPV